MTANQNDGRISNQAIVLIDSFMSLEKNRDRFAVNYEPNIELKD